MFRSGLNRADSNARTSKNSRSTRARIDIHVTQDVFEHIRDPFAAFGEIARTLKPGGAYIFTVPLVRQHSKSEFRAKIIDGELVHLKSPQYHGNPIDNKGSLVTIDWGYDICRHIHAATGHYTQMFIIDDLTHGIRAKLNEVLVTQIPTDA